MVWRELPVLGPDSEEAAQVSLAAAKAGRFKPFHDRMFALGRPTAGTMAQARQAAGIRRRGREDAGLARRLAELRRNYELAQIAQAPAAPPPSSSATRCSRAPSATTRSSEAVARRPRSGEGRVSLATRDGLRPASAG